MRRSTHPLRPLVPIRRRRSAGCRQATFSLLAAVVGLAACRAPESYTTRIDLVEALAAAETHHEPGILDFGTGEARSFLGRGWSWNERSQDSTFVWAVGDSSELTFFLASARRFELEIRCFPFSFPEGSAQVLHPLVNETPLPPVTLESGPNTYRIPVPIEATRSGINRLSFQYAYSRSPRAVFGAGDQRSLAVGWDWIRFHLHPEAEASEVSTSNGEIVLPLGTGVDFYFEATGRDRLAFDAIHLPEGAGSELRIGWQVDGHGEMPLLQARTSSAGATVDLPHGERQPVRLSLRVAVGSGDPLSTRLVRPRIETLATSAGAARPVETSGAGLSSKPLPDILVYVVDTLRADHLGTYGYPREISPRIDEFAEHAFVFDQAIAQTSWTKPAVASIFTGLPTTVHGVNHRQHRLAARFQTMAELLSEASYQTVAFTTNAYFSADSGLRQGFDEFGLQPAGADRVHQRIFDWLDRRSDQEPFFLYVHTIDPHAPYDPPASYRREFAEAVEDPAAGSFEQIRGLASGQIPRTPQTDRDLVDLYDAEIAFADHQFGLLVDDLRRRRLYDELLIVLLSDHGEGFYEHGIQGHGWDLHREALQVPLILKLPGMGRGRRVAEPVQHIDLLPTLLDLAGIARPDFLQGRSLVPILGEDSRSDSGQVPIFSYLDYDGRRGMSLIQGPWKLIEPLAAGFTPSRQLYQRLEDPDEQVDRAADFPVLAGYLATLIRQQLLELERRPEAETMEFDDETREQLKALGYLE